MHKFINRVKKHRHNKIKRKHINQFERLLDKNGYSHNFYNQCTNNRCPPLANNKGNRLVTINNNNNHNKHSTNTTTKPQQL